MKIHMPWLSSSQTFMGSGGKVVTPDANGICDIPNDDAIVAIKMGALKTLGMPQVRRTTASNAANCTLAANAMAFGREIYIFFSGAAAITANTAPAANIISVMPAARLYDTWTVRVINTNSGNLTLAGGNGVSFNGTAVIAANRYVDFMGLINDGNTVVYYNVGFGNAT